MEFSSALPTVMHIDLNSCFAMIEQQANPFLRGKPIAVGAYTTGNGCILAASVEAKRFGIKTCMRVRDGKKLCPRLIVLPPDPDKYRYINRQLLTLLEEYAPHVSVESIDEMVMDMGWKVGRGREVTDIPAAMQVVAREIKERIRRDIGEWLTVSIGIAPNRYLAKVASGLHKPDGLDVITRETIESIFAGLKLEDLCGIKTANANRLRWGGIQDPLVMLHASPGQLQLAFHSIVGHQWWMRLHGWEDGSMYKAFGSTQEDQKSFGQSHALGKPYLPSDPSLLQILSQLVMKMGRRLREAKASARSIAVSLLFTDYTHWGGRSTYTTTLYADVDFYKRACELLQSAPSRPVRICAVYCFNLEYNLYCQEELFTEDVRKKQLTIALDSIHTRFGDFVVTPGRMLSMEQKVLDRIAFGKVRDLDRASRTQDQLIL